MERRSVNGLVLSLILLLCTCPPVWSAEPEDSGYLLDPSTGEIDGKIAVAVYPVTYVDSRVDQFLDPQGFEAHLTPEDDPEVELVFPCGSWFQPPARKRYRVWIEGNGQMSPYSSKLIYGGGLFQGRGLPAALPVVAAGRVVVPAGIGESSHLELRLIRAVDHLEGHLARWELSRRRRTDEIGEGILMPHGPAIGGLWDRRRQTYVALSRPFEVKAGASVEAPLELPIDVAHLVVQVKRRVGASTIDGYDVQMRLARAGTETAPDVKVSTATTVYAFWYDLDPGPAVLAADSPDDFLDRQSLDLLPGEIERITGSLRARPGLDVQIDLPAAMEDEDLSLEVLSVPDESVIATQALAHNMRTVRFDKLSPGLFKVVLKTSVGSFSRQVDLSEGEDGFLLLEPALIVVSGTVYRGTDGHPAQLEFHTVRRTTAEARADDLGAYQVMLIEPLRSVSIKLASTDEAPFFEFFPNAISETQELDFRVPAGRFSVKVFNALSGEAIPGAQILLRNLFAARGGDEEESGAIRPQSDMTVAQEVKTDDSGVALLPPLRSGSVELLALADGYAKMDEPVSAAIIDPDKDQTFEVPLRPMGSTVALRLTLPDGTAAADAEILLVQDLGGSEVHSGRADVEGVVEVPGESQGAILLARHPAAGFLVRLWTPIEGEEEVHLQLSPRADHPLHVVVKDPSGEDAVPRAELAVWVNGHRLSGRILAWLADARPSADANGIWRGYNFPRGEVSVLAWRQVVRGQAYAGVLDGLAVDIEFPWPDRIELHVVQ